MPAPLIIDGDRTVSAGETLSVTDPDLIPLGAGSDPDRPMIVYMSGSGTGRFINHGSLTAVLLSGTSGWLEGFAVARTSSTSSSSLFDNALDGRLMVDSRWFDGGGNPAIGLTAAFYAPGASIAFHNEGVIDVRGASGDVYGSLSGGTPAAFANSGSISVASAYRAIGVRAALAGPFNNSGTIAVTGELFAEGVHWDSASPAVFINRGTITATTGLASPHASIGVFQGAEASGTGILVIQNSGTIEADVAILASQGTAGAIAANITNSGSIIGDLILGSADDLVVNAGLIEGRVALGPGNDRYVAIGGTQHGGVEGGSGNDQLTGGSMSDTLFGDNGNDVISAGAGDDYIDGGWGSDRLDGGAGDDTLSFALSYCGVRVELAAGLAFDGGAWDRVSGFEGVVGSRFGDVIIGNGRGNYLRGLSGDDEIRGGGGADVIRGDPGDDVLSGGGGDDVYLFQAGDGHDIIRDFSSGDVVRIFGYVAPQSLQQVGTAVVLTLSSDDSITFADTQLVTIRSAITLTAAAFACARNRDRRRERQQCVAG